MIAEPEVLFRLVDNMTVILQDTDIEIVPAMALALEALEMAFVAKASGELVSPPRHHVSLPGFGDLVFTIGGLVGSPALAGFRVYDTFAGPDHTQIIAVWSADNAKLEGLVIGNRLGEIRTGAIGGIAIRHMSAAGAVHVGVVGTGRQAHTQVLAAAAVRQLESVRVYSRSEANRAAFARDMQSLLGIPVEPVSSAQQAVQQADIVICATTSSTPVIDAAWIKPGAHINTVGPKTRHAHEIGLDVANMADIIATDSPEQTRAYDTPFFLAGTRSGDRMMDLAQIVTGKVAARATGNETTLFCSTGLAGTEVLIAAKVIEAFKAKSGSK